jgi:hypothetical protein
MQSHRHTWFDRFAEPYARLVVARPGTVLLLIVLLSAISVLGARKLTINSNQLDLISKDLPEVKAVERVIDMVGGVGHLILALRSEDEKQLKQVADDLAARITADKERVRELTYKVPVDFFQEKMVLFVETADLIEAKDRINKYVRDQIKRKSPFFVEIRKTEPVKLDLQDLVDKYSRIGKKSIADDYYISPDRKMMLMLIKPMWDANQLGKTKDLLDAINQTMADYSRDNPAGVKLVEDYDLMGKTGVIAYGYTGVYKTSVDDSYAIADSVDRVGLIAFSGIFLVTLIFFRRLWPSLIVITGTALGYLITMGFTYVSVGQLNMITIVLVGILAGFGVDYGIHFTYRTRIELGLGKPPEEALRAALINAGRPATVASIVTGGSFLVLMMSEFRGFSQFGLLAGVGTMVIGFVLFTFTPAVLALLARRWPSLPERIVGRMEPLAPGADGAELRIPRPRLMLAGSAVVVVALCAVAYPWRDVPVVVGQSASLEDRLTGGVRFNYNTRALMAEDENSVRLQDEVNVRFQISSDPTAVYTPTIEEARAVYDELTKHPEKYSTIDQVVSMFSFVPEPARAEANAKVLAEWKQELSDVDRTLFPDDLQDEIALFERILDAKPYGLDGLPERYQVMFRELPTAKPENKGYLTFIYPRVDLWDGKQMLEFSDQTGVITTASGQDVPLRRLADAVRAPRPHRALGRQVRPDRHDDLDPADALPRLPLDGARARLGAAARHRPGHDARSDGADRPPPELHEHHHPAHPARFRGQSRPVPAPQIPGGHLTRRRAEIRRRGGGVVDADGHRRLRVADARPAQRRQIHRVRRLPRSHDDADRVVHRARRGAAAPARPPHPGRRREPAGLTPGALGHCIGFPNVRIGSIPDTPRRRDA